MIDGDSARDLDLDHYVIATMCIDELKVLLQGSCLHPTEYVLPSEEWVARRFSYQNKVRAGDYNNYYMV